MARLDGRTMFVAALTIFSLCAVVLSAPESHHGHHHTPSDCPPCDVDECQVPEGCLAGRVKDKCNCCYVCARTEGERCDHPIVPTVHKHTYGECGDKLECRLREDLKPEDPPEAICFCRHTDVVCGTDGKTYHNLCLLMEQAHRTRDGLKVKARGPCRSEPWIVTGPDDTTEKQGSNVALACEAMGFPIPSIEWHVSRSDGTELALPSDNQHVAVQARGGPEQYEITGWLQLLEISEEDDGKYECVARNELGEARAAAKITVTKDSSDENDL